MASQIGQSEKLIDIFNKVWKLYHDLDASTEPSNSQAFQASVADALKQVLFLLKSMEELSMFSINETVDEIPTEDLRYFLLHALAASLNSKKQCDISNRLEMIQESLGHYTSFFKLCSLYHIGDSLQLDVIMKKNEGAKAPVQSRDIAALSAEREAKIARFRKSKEQAQQIREMEGKLQDEEISRKYWLLQLEKWIDCAQDETASMKTEVEMLSRFQNVSREEIEQARKPKNPPMKPFVLTRDKLQASVFGAGYPSLPTMTLDEYFQKEVEAGRLPDQSVKPQNENSQRDKDDNLDADDDEALKKQRDFDDWKDTHRRGAGNRKNMG